MNTPPSRPRNSLRVAPPKSACSDPQPSRTLDLADPDPEQLRLRLHLHPSTADLLEVAAALARFDDLAIERLRLRRRDRDAFMVQLRLCVGVASVPMGKDRGAGRSPDPGMRLGAGQPMPDRQALISTHAQLWAMPIVVQPGYLSPQEGGSAELLQMLQARLGRWIAPREAPPGMVVDPSEFIDAAAGSLHPPRKRVERELVMAHSVATMDTISGFAPGGMQQLLVYLTQIGLSGTARGQGMEPSTRQTVLLKAPPQESKAIAGLPTLHFVLGALRAAVYAPEFESSDYQGARGEAAMRDVQDLVGLMVAAPDRDNHPPHQSHRVLLPTPWSEALVAGYSMWLHELCQHVRLRAWDVTHHSSGRLLLTLHGQRPDAVESEFMISVRLNQWQLGRRGLARLLLSLPASSRQEGLAEVGRLRGLAGHEEDGGAAWRQAWWG